MNQIKVIPPAEETQPLLHQTSSANNACSTSTQEGRLQTIEPGASAEAPDGHEAYERGTVLKNVGLFKQAAEHFEKAAQDPAYALKGFAQMGLSLRKNGKHEEAVAAFRRALQVPATSVKQQVQILYLLGRTLESLERIPEALEAYRWLRRESPQYRDVAKRIESLSTKRVNTLSRQGHGNSPWAQQALQMWQGLLRSGKQRSNKNLSRL